MLVLSRKKDDAIQFPDLGITIQILDTGNRAAKVGVAAPVDVKIVRDEILDDEDRETIEQRVFRIPGEMRHEIRNELNLLSLALHVFKRKVELGEAVDCQSAFEKIVDRIEKISEHSCFGPASGDGHELPGTKALLIEDCDNERELLAGFLEMHGFEIESVSNGQDALEYLENNEPPEAILLDMQLPDVSGSAILKAIRQSERFDDSFVIVISGSKPSDNDLTTDDGMDAWFEKPVDPRKLVGTLSKSQKN